MRGWEGTGPGAPVGCVDSRPLTDAVDESAAPVRFRKDSGKVRRFVAEARRAVSAKAR